MDYLTRIFVGKCGYPRWHWWINPNIHAFTDPHGYPHRWWTWVKLCAGFDGSQITFERMKNVSIPCESTLKMCHCLALRRLKQRISLSLSLSPPAAATAATPQSRLAVFFEFGVCCVWWPCLPRPCQRLGICDFIKWVRVNMYKIPDCSSLRWLKVQFLRFTSWTWRVYKRDRSTKTWRR